MKKTLLITLFLIIFSNFSYGQFWKPKKQPEKPVEISKKEEIVSKPKQSTSNSSSVSQAKAIIVQLNNELNTAKALNSDLNKQLTSANESLEKSEIRLAEVQKNADLLKQWGIEQETQAFAWMDKFNKCLKRYHFLKNIVAVLAGLYGFILGLSCMKYVPPTYSAYAYALPFVGAILGFFAVWVFL